jgi:hypothetical protein
VFEIENARDDLVAHLVQPAPRLPARDAAAVDPLALPGRRPTRSPPGAPCRHAARADHRGDRRRSGRGAYTRTTSAIAASPSALNTALGTPPSLAHPYQVPATEQGEQWVVAMCPDEVHHPHQILMGGEVEIVDKDEAEKVRRQVQGLGHTMIGPDVADHDAAFGGPLGHLRHQPGLADAGRATISLA